MYNTKLKMSQSENINNIFVKSTQVEFKKSQAGWEYAEVKLGDHTIIIDSKFAHTLPNGAVSIGIKDNFKYKLIGTDSTVLGKDLFKYVKDVNAEIKSKEVEADTKETKKTTTTTKKSTK